MEKTELIAMQWLLVRLATDVALLFNNPEEKVEIYHREVDEISALAIQNQNVEVAGVMSSVSAMLDKVRDNIQDMLASRPTQM